MDIDDLSQTCESIIPFIPPNNDSRRIHQQEVRLTPRQKLLHFFPLTVEDEPLQKKRFFGPATVVPRNCESLIPFNRERASIDCGSDTDLQRGRPMLLGFVQEGMQTSEADQGILFVNRSETEFRAPPHQDLCALSLATRSDKEPSPDRDLCALSLATYHASLPLLEVGADQGIDITNWRENELGPWDRDLCTLSLAMGPAALSLLEVGASRSLLKVGASRPRTVISPQPVRAILNNNTRLVALASAQLAQARAQPPAQLGVQPPVTQLLVQPVQHRLQCPAHPQAQPFAQLGTQPPMGQPLGQSIQPLAHPRAQPHAQQSVQPSAQPHAQQGTQPSPHSPAQPRAKPQEQRLQPPAQPLAQHQAQHRCQSPEQCRAQPQEQPIQPPGQPRAHGQAQHRAWAQTHSPTQSQAQPAVQSLAQPRHWPLEQRQAQPVQPRALPPAQPQGQGRVQPPAAQQQARAQCRAQPQLPAAPPPVRHGPQSQTSCFKGVTLYKRTGRWEAHIWGQNKKQIYLGASSTENQAARAYDRAAIYFRGVNAQINFPLADYQNELPRLDPAAITPTQLVTMLRKQSAGRGTLNPEYPQP